MLKSSRSARVLLPVVFLAAVFFSACSLTTQQAAVAPSPVPYVSHASGLNSFQGTTYNQVVFYNNPAGGEDVGFTLTLDESGTILDADAEIRAVNPTSVGLQTNFKAEIKPAVVGKRIAELQVDRIGGASLTTGAFQQFLTDIKSQNPEPSNDPMAI